MNDVDFYMLSGVPNTSLQWLLFQKRDLELIGCKTLIRGWYYEALATFWNSYEIMGVSLVDIQVWEWLCKSQRNGSTVKRICNRNCKGCVEQIMLVLG